MNPNKNGCIVLVIGRQGSGKTPIIKELMKKFSFSNNIVFDPRHEYAEDYTLFHKYATFVKQFPTFTKSLIVIEEATGFISAAKNMDLAEELIAVEHKQNVIVFVFHSCMDVPKYILRLARFIKLLDTNDDPESIRTQRPELYEYLNEPKPVTIDQYS